MQEEQKYIAIAVIVDLWKSIKMWLVHCTYSHWKGGINKLFVKFWKPQIGNKKFSYQLRFTVVSGEAKKKQHAHPSSGLGDHYSELFTWMAALKFKNAVIQPP